MKFNPPCYSVIFELFESLTDSSFEKASLNIPCISMSEGFVYLCVCVCSSICHIVRTKKKVKENVLTKIEIHVCVCIRVALSHSNKSIKLTVI